MRKIIITIILIGVFIFGFGTGVITDRFIYQKTASKIEIQLASQTTILFPSQLTYIQQTAFEKGTGLEGVDFIYVEKLTGIDAATLMALAWHESDKGTNYWAVNYNNVMSWGISEINPSHYYYKTKTLNVFEAAQGLKSLYLTTTAPYYGGGLTLWDINKYYASDTNWANGVNSILKELESKLTPEQQMRRWILKTGLFNANVIWDYEHEVTGWTLYKANLAKVIIGR